jgi:hypothetical protein
MTQPLDRRELEGRLECWAEEYGGGRYEHIGFPSRNVLGKLVEQQGHIPRTGTPATGKSPTLADEVEDAVKLMEAQGYGRPAAVIRVEFFNRRVPVETKLKVLERGTAGFKISRKTYYEYLGIAKAFVHGQLTQRAA